MTDTIQKIADEMQSFIGISSPLQCFVDRLRALSARASAGEGGEWVMVPRRLTAENGAKGLLSGEFAEYFEMSCGECASVDDKDAEHCDVCDGKGVYRVAIPVGWDTIKKIHRMVVDNLATTTPQPAQAGASGGGEVWVDPEQLTAWFANPAMNRLHPQPQQTKKYSLALTPASPATGEDFEAWFAKQDSRTEWRELVRLAYYATPQPESAGEWDSFDERAGTRRGA